MSPDSIQLIDKRAALCWKPCNSQNVARGLIRAVRQSLMADSWRRAEEEATKIWACLDPSTRGAYPRGAYAILKHWYRHAYAQATNPSRTDMDKVKGDLQTLYQKEDPHPPGLTLATHVDPAKVNKNISLEAEVEAALRRLLPHRMVGHTHLRTEHLKHWQQEAYPR